MGNIEMCRATVKEDMETYPDVNFEEMAEMVVRKTMKWIAQCKSIRARYSAAFAEQPGLDGTTAEDMDSQISYLEDAQACAFKYQCGVANEYEELYFKNFVFTLIEEGK